MRSEKSKSTGKPASQSPKVGGENMSDKAITVEELVNEAQKMKDLFAALYFIFLQDARGIKGLERVRHMVNQLKRPIIDHSVMCRMVLLIERDRLEAEAIEQRKYMTVH